MTKPYIPYDGPVVTRREAIKLGMDRYYTGKPCKYGHFSQRNVKMRICDECRRGIKRSQYQNTKEWYQKYYVENKERKQSLCKAWNEKNRDKRREYTRIFQANNHQRVKKSRIASEAKRRSVDGKFDDCHIQEIGNLQNWLCNNCQCDISSKYHIDHVIPIALGGTSWPENLQLLCPPCNMKKRCKSPSDWDMENGRKSEVDGWLKFQREVILRLKLPTER